MDRRTLLTTSVCAAGLLASHGAAAAALPASGPRKELSFDDGWRFSRGEAAGAQQASFDDSGWPAVQLPHDWSIEDLPGAPKAPTDWQAPLATWTERRLPPHTKPEFALGGARYPVAPVPGGPPLKIGPFDPNASGAGWGTGWFVGGLGWYRKTFQAPPLTAGERVEIRFDGAFSEAEVWCNGVRVGSNVYGYGAFAFDITRQVRPSGPNVLAVRVTNEGETARWYSGSGLNRHVWLTVTGPVRVTPWGLAVSTPTISDSLAAVNIEVEIDSRLQGATPISVLAQVRDPAGRTVAEGHRDLTVGAGAAKAQLALRLAKPRLWNPDRPYLYTAQVSLLADGKPTDRATTRFGVRSIAVSPERGLQINGRPVKLKGACIHSDNGLLGTAAIDRAERRKAELLKANGYNAVRLAHNMYPPAFLDACDELGLVVLDEVFDVWEQAKFFKNDYSTHFKSEWRRDITRMVRQDRNHPSVIFWSIGNEIPERNAPRGVEIAAELRKAIRELDTSRPIYAAINGPTGQEGEPSRRSLDVVGYNYQHRAFEPDHAKFPGLVFMSTEQSAQDICDSWRTAEAHPYVLGDFVWTGIDYLGEVGAGSSELRPLSAPAPAGFSIFLWDYPAFQSGCGEIDILGHRKPQGLYRDVLWGRSALELLVQRPTPPGTYERLDNWGWHDELESWTWPGSDGRAFTVRAYTPGDEVRLLLNGNEVGRKPVKFEDRLTATFELPYSPGVLTAIALRSGREIGRRQLTTTGAPARLRLRAERSRIAASPNDLAYVFAEVCDARGRKVPDAAVPLTFSLQGAARLRATGSANPRGIESFTDPSCRAFHGEALAIVQGAATAGRATLSVNSPGLTGDLLTLQVG